ncbi:MAG: hypothetical protein ABIR51_10550 [Sphingomicrobium sp.]
MNNPFALWTGWLRAGRMVGETIQASHAVIAKRGETIAEAARDPLAADHAELTRMVAEKGAAFAKAGTSLAGDWAAMQADVAAQMRAMSAFWLGGRLPSAAAAGAMIDRSARISQRALASGVKALRPIHATATANQRRLSNKKRA